MKVFNEKKYLGDIFQDDLKNVQKLKEKQIDLEILITTCEGEENLEKPDVV